MSQCNYDLRTVRGKAFVTMEKIIIIIITL